MDRRAIGSWLSGPGAVAGDAGLATQRYRGERLGLPEEGENSIAPVGRRLLALLIDWLLCYLIAAGFGFDVRTPSGQLAVLAIFAAEYLVLHSTIGFTVGMRLTGLKVVRLGGPLTPLHVITRTVLLCLVIPAVVWDRDTRTLHDRLSQTAVVLR